MSFTVVAQCGAVSNSWEAKFTATRDMKPLPFDQITCFSFAIGNSDECQTMGQNNFPIECGSIPPVGTGGVQTTGFYGYHASGWGGGETGNDEFDTNFGLSNGWVVDHVTDLSWSKMGNGSYASESWASPFGATSPGVNVNWKADACGLITYSGDIYITGPVGVPYH